MIDQKFCPNGCPYKFLVSRGQTNYAPAAYRLPQVPVLTGLNFVDLLPICFKFCGSNLHHENHENLYTTKFNTFTVSPSYGNQLTQVLLFENVSRFFSYHFPVSSISVAFEQDLLLIKENNGLVTQDCFLTMLNLCICDHLSMLPQPHICVYCVYIRSCKCVCTFVRVNVCVHFSVVASS